MATPQKNADAEQPPGHAVFGTPCRSLLKSAGPARRIEHSALKDAPAFNYNRALDHFSLFDRVQELEAERDTLKRQVAELRRELVASQDKAALQVLVPAEPVHEVAASAGAQQADLEARVACLQEELIKEQTERRKAHNELVDLRGNIRVYCRVRPLHGAEQSAVRPSMDKRSLAANVTGQDHVFSFSHVFGPTESQPSVFAEVSELVQSTLDGYSVCIFSYGQTGAGKTHTMTGSEGEGRGLIPRALEKIIDRMEQLKVQDWTYSLECSVLELYNDRLRDLLDPRAKEITDMNDIKHEEGGHSTVVGISRLPLSNISQALQLISRASSSRASHATAMNASSSRSHCLLMLHVTGRHSSGTVLKGMLNMVDLAGSERLVRSRAEGERKTETCAINQSLSSLQGVFEALSGSKPGGSRHIPYRDSKLTYLLKPCLSKGGKALMFVHVSPEQASANETLVSLRFATKVAGVEVGPAKQRIEPGYLEAAASGPTQVFHERQPTQGQQQKVRSSSGRTAPIGLAASRRRSIVKGAPGAQGRGLMVGRAASAPEQLMAQTATRGSGVEGRAQGGRASAPEQQQQQQQPQHRPAGSSAAPSISRVLLPSVAESVEAEAHEEEEGDGGASAAHAIDLRSAFRKRRHEATPADAAAAEEAPLGQEVKTQKRASKWH